MNRSIFMIMACLFLGGHAQAGFAISISNGPIYENMANQAIDILLTSDSQSDPAIKGWRLGATVVRNISPTFPFATELQPQLTTSAGGFFWDENGGSNVEFFSPQPAVFEVKNTFIGAAQTVNNGSRTTVKLGTFVVNTTGLFSGTYLISLNDDFYSGLQPTVLVDPSNQAFAGVVVNGGGFTIVPVPEPSSIALLGFGAVGIAGWKRRRASRIAIRQ